MDKNHTYVGCGSTSSEKRNRVKRFRELAEEERQAGIQGQWQHESPAREYLEQVKCCHDTDCTERVDEERLHRPERWRLGKNIKYIFRAEVKASEWAFDRIKEAFEQVAQDDAETLSLVQDIMIRSTDHLRRIVPPVGGQGGVTMSCLCPAL